MQKRQVIFRTKELDPEKIIMVESGYIEKGPDKDTPVWTRVEFCTRERAIELTKRLWLEMLTEE